MRTTTYELTKTERDTVEAIRRLPTHCRAQTAKAITEFVITFHSGMTADEMDNQATANASRADAEAHRAAHACAHRACRGA